MTPLPQLGSSQIPCTQLSSSSHPPASHSQSRVPGSQPVSQLLPSPLVASSLSDAVDPLTVSSTLVDPWVCALESTDWFGFGSVHALDPKYPSNTKPAANAEGPRFEGHARANLVGRLGRLANSRTACFSCAAEESSSIPRVVTSDAVGQIEGHLHFA